MAATTILPLVDRLIPGGIEKYLSTSRQDGQSYQQIRDRLVNEHGITVTPATVRNWCHGYEIAKAS